MKEYIKKKWLDWTVPALISLLIFFVTLKVTSVQADTKELNTKIDSKASIVEVKEWDKELKLQIDKGFLEHKQIKDELNSRLQRIEDKQDATNEKILDIWKNMKSKGN